MEVKESAHQLAIEQRETGQTCEEHLYTKCPCTQPSTKPLYPPSSTTTEDTKNDTAINQMQRQAGKKCPHCNLFYFADKCACRLTTPQLPPPAIARHDAKINDPFVLDDDEDDYSIIAKFFGGLFIASLAFGTAVFFTGGTIVLPGVLVFTAAVAALGFTAIFWPDNLWPCAKDGIRLMLMPKEEDEDWTPVGKILVIGLITALAFGAAVFFSGGLVLPIVPIITGATFALSTGVICTLPIGEYLHDFLHWATRRSRDFAEMFFGRANAGRWGRILRVMRTIGTLLSIITIIVCCVIYGASAVFTAGMSLPTVPLALILTGAALNSFSGIHGWGGNTAKVETNYDHEVFILAITNDQKKQKILEDIRKFRISRGIAKKDDNENNALDLPHEFAELWYANRPLCFTRVKRHFHTFNAVGGSILSGISFLAFLIDPTLVIPELITISRNSAFLSAIGSWYTNDDRLQKHAKLIHFLWQQYFAGEELAHPTYFKRISEKIIDPLELADEFDTKSIKGYRRYEKFIIFTAKRVLLENEALIGKISGEDDAQNKTVKKVIKEILADYLSKENRSSSCCLKHRLRTNGEKNLREISVEEKEKLFISTPQHHKHERPAFYQGLSRYNFFTCPKGKEKGEPAKHEYATLDALHELAAIIYWKLAELVLGAEKLGKIRKFAEDIVEASYKKEDSQSLSKWQIALIFYIQQAITNQVIADESIDVPTDMADWDEEKVQLIKQTKKFIDAKGEVNREKLHKSFGHEEIAGNPHDHGAHETEVNFVPGYHGPKIAQKIVDNGFSLDEEHTNANRETDEHTDTEKEPTYGANCGDEYLKTTPTFSRTHTLMTTAVC